MQHSSSSSGGLGVVVAVALLLLVIIIGLVGLGAGFFFLSVRAPAVMTGPPPVTVMVEEASPAPRFPHAVPLSDFDVKDTLEGPAMVVTPSGRLLVAVASQLSAEERVLTLIHSDDGGVTHSPPRELRRTRIFTSVSHSNGREVKRPVRLLPQLAVGGGKVFLGWLEPNAANTTIHYYVAESTDDGDSFGPPLRVHESEGAAPNFIALAADTHGNVAASWLDSRAGIKQPFAAVKLADDEAFQPETQVYASPNERGVCPCCPTAVAISPHGEVLVAFRNSLDGYRDIYLAARKLEADSEFGPARRVTAEPRWQFDGCPHDGPSLAVNEGAIWVAWMDASEGTPACYFTAAVQGEADFQEPERLNDERPGAQGNARLLLVGDGLVAAWEQQMPAADAAAGSDNEAATAEEPDGERRHDHAHAAGGERLVMGAHMPVAIGPGYVWHAPGAPLWPMPNAFQTRPAVAVDPQGRFHFAFCELDEQGKRLLITSAERAHITGAGH